MCKAFRKKVARVLGKCYKIRSKNLMLLLITKRVVEALWLKGYKP